MDDVRRYLWWGINSGSNSAHSGQVRSVTGAGTAGTAGQARLPSQELQKAFSKFRPHPGTFTTCLFRLTNIPPSRTPVQFAHVALSNASDSDSRLRLSPCRVCYVCASHRQLPSSESVLETHSMSTASIVRDVAELETASPRHCYRPLHTNLHFNPGSTVLVASFRST